MNICKKCSAEVVEDKAFCPNCGAAMIPERQRMQDSSEGMGETMYGQSAVADPSAFSPTVTPPRPAPPRPTPPPSPVVAAPAPAPLASESPRRQPPAKAQNAAKEAPKATREAPKAAPDANNSRLLHVILVAAAVFFALSLLLVAILYITGNI